MANHPSLDNKVRNDAVKSRSVIQTQFSQLKEAANMFRSLFRIESNFDFTKLRVDDCLITGQFFDRCIGKWELFFGGTVTLVRTNNLDPFLYSAFGICRKLRDLFSNRDPLRHPPKGSELTIKLRLIGHAHEKLRAC